MAATCFFDSTSACSGIDDPSLPHTACPGLEPRRESRHERLELDSGLHGNDVITEIPAFTGMTKTGYDSSSLIGDDSLKLIIRIDDIGFNHASNVALRRLLDECVFTSVSVLVNTPWIDETAAILRQHPDVSVGVHLALNSEWREFRWGPVLPVAEVPSLVDADGHFYGNRADFMRNRPKVEEVARELRAQVDLALRKGFNISYVDYHMGTALSTWEFQQEVEKIATEYGIGISRYFGEVDTDPIYRVSPEEKTEGGVKIIENLGDSDEPEDSGYPDSTDNADGSGGLDDHGLFLMVVHPGTDLPEMSVLTDLNAFGPKNMSKHRQGETDMLCADSFREAIRAKGIKLIDYNDLKTKGLHLMQRPREAPPYDEVFRDAAIKTAEARETADEK